MPVEEKVMKSFKKATISQDLPDAFSSKGREDYLRHKRRERFFIFTTITVLAVLLFGVLWLVVFTPRQIQGAIENNFKQGLGANTAAVTIEGNAFAIAKGNFDGLELALTFKDDAPVGLSGLNARWHSEPALYQMIKAGLGGSAQCAPNKLTLSWNNAALTTYLANTVAANGKLLNFTAAAISPQGIALYGEALLFGNLTKVELLLVPELAAEKLVLTVDKVKSGGQVIRGYEGEVFGEAVLAVPGLAWPLKGLELTIEDNSLTVTAEGIS